MKSLDEITSIVYNRLRQNYPSENIFHNVNFEDSLKLAIEDALEEDYSVGNTKQKEICHG